MKTRDENNAKFGEIIALDHEFKKTHNVSFKFRPLRGGFVEKSPWGGLFEQKN